MANAKLRERLAKAHTGWPLWDELLGLVDSLDFEYVEDMHLGNHFASGVRLSFAEADHVERWPDWMPAYVPALFGMKADSWETAGGFADMFSGTLARRGRLFSSVASDERLGFPAIDPPPGTYEFQSNNSGATFYVNRALEVVWPSAQTEQFQVLDSLEVFAQTNIAQALAGKAWGKAYLGRGPEDYMLE